MSPASDEVFSNSVILEGKDGILWHYESPLEKPWSRNYSNGNIQSANTDMSKQRPLIFIHKLL